MSELRISQAASGNLNYLRIFELIAFFLVFGGANDGDVLNKGLHFIIFHARLGEELLGHNLGIG